MAAGNKMATGSSAETGNGNELLYMTEAKVWSRDVIKLPDVIMSRVPFRCDLFSREDVGYCFYHVSQLNSGKEEVRNRICLPSQFNPDGQWSDWSNWTPCSVTCGQGWTNRKRSCDNPKPEVGGMFCRGRDVQRKKCYERMCLHENLKSEVDGTFDANLTHVCPCGCVAVQRSGYIKLSPFHQLQQLQQQLQQLQQQQPLYQQQQQQPQHQQQNRKNKKLQKSKFYYQKQQFNINNNININGIANTYINNLLQLVCPKQMQQTRQNNNIIFDNNINNSTFNHSNFSNNFNSNTRKNKINIYKHPVFTWYIETPDFNKVVKMSFLITSSSSSPSSSLSSSSSSFSPKSSPITSPTSSSPRSHPDESFEKTNTNKNENNINPANVYKEFDDDDDDYDDENDDVIDIDYLYEQLRIPRQSRPSRMKFLTSPFEPVVRVRDGWSSTSSVLLTVSGYSSATVRSAVSTGNRMLVEYYPLGVADGRDDKITEVKKYESRVETKNYDDEDNDDDVDDDDEEENDDDDDDDNEAYNYDDEDEFDKVNESSKLEGDIDDMSDIDEDDDEDEVDDDDDDDGNAEENDVDDEEEDDDHDDDIKKMYRFNKKFQKIFHTTSSSPSFSSSSLTFMNIHHLHHPHHINLTPNLEAVFVSVEVKNTQHNTTIPPSSTFDTLLVVVIVIATVGLLLLVLLLCWFCWHRTKTALRRKKGKCQVGQMLLDANSMERSDIQLIQCSKIKNNRDGVIACYTFDSNLLQSPVDSPTKHFATISTRAATLQPQQQQQQSYHKFKFWNKCVNKQHNNNIHNNNIHSHASHNKNRYSTNVNCYHHEKHFQQFVVESKMTSSFSEPTLRELITPDKQQILIQQKQQFLQQQLQQQQHQQQQQQLLQQQKHKESKKQKKREKRKHDSNFAYDEDCKNNNNNNDNNNTHATDPHNGPDNYNNKSNESNKIINANNSNTMHINTSTNNTTTTTTLTSTNEVTSTTATTTTITATTTATKPAISTTTSSKLMNQPILNKCDILSQYSINRAKQPTPSTSTKQQQQQQQHTINNSPASNNNNNNINNNINNNPTKNSNNNIKNSISKFSDINISNDSLNVSASNNCRIPQNDINKDISNEEKSSTNQANINTTNTTPFVTTNQHKNNNNNIKNINAQNNNNLTIYNNSPSFKSTPSNKLKRSSKPDCDVNRPNHFRTPSFSGSCSSTPSKKSLTFDALISSSNEDGLEYDDYTGINLPGSYFTMDPLAYTLTWSKPPKEASS